MNNEQSGVNTVLLVVIIIAIAAGVFLVYGNRSAGEQTDSATVNVNLPTIGNENPTNPSR